LAICGVSSLLFRAAVVKGSFGLALPGRLLVGAVLVCVLVCANLLGLLVQSVFYYACKAFHNQKIDRTALVHNLEMSTLEGKLAAQLDHCFILAVLISVDLSQEAIWSCCF
jgi:hypothetical protein